MSIFGHFWPLIPPNPGLRIFTRKTKTSLFLFYCYTTLCQKSERSNVRFSRKKCYERTDGRTDGRRWINRSHFCLRQGTKNEFLKYRDFNFFCPFLAKNDVFSFNISKNPLGIPVFVIFFLWFSVWKYMKNHQKQSLKAFSAREKSLFGPFMIFHFV